MCDSWTVWRAEQATYARAIRNGGMRSPILVGTPRRSADARLLGHYRLPDRNVVYGVHVDGGGRADFGAPERRAVERVLAPGRGRLAIVVDELARMLPGSPPAGPVWSRRYVSYVANWVVHRGGDGAIASTWRRGDPNSVATRKGGLTAWGAILASRFVALAWAPGATTSGRMAPRAELRYGYAGFDVRALQRDLADLGYLTAGRVTGSYDYGTEQAVMAFQGYEGMGRDGVAGAGTRARLGIAVRPVADRGGAAHVEISIGQQVLLLVDRGGKVRRAIHVSSGAAGNTPRGLYSVYRKETMSWSIPFSSWMPLASYFTGGFAMHQYGHVPGYPASHGCVRMPFTEAGMVYAFAGYGMPVWVH